MVVIMTIIRTIGQHQSPDIVLMVTGGVVLRCITVKLNKTVLSLVIWAHAALAAATGRIKYCVQVGS